MAAEEEVLNATYFSILYFNRKRLNVQYDVQYMVSVDDNKERKVRTKKSH